MNHIKTGEFGEQVAAAYLTGAGYSIVGKKYRTKTGEIDIIAHKDGTLVFVEVKTRRGAGYGRPAEAVNYRKQQKIINTALCYLHYTHRTGDSIRFDIVEVILLPNGTRSINHIENAFGR